MLNFYEFYLDFHFFPSCLSNWLWKMLKTLGSYFSFQEKCLILREFHAWFYDLAIVYFLSDE